MSSVETRRIAFLKRTFLFGPLSLPHLGEIVAWSRLRRYARGELVFQKGDQPKGLFVVVSGKIKEACQSADGDEKIIELFGPGQVIGEGALLLGSPYPYHAMALVGTQLLHIDGGAIHELIDHEPAFARRMLEALSGRIYGIVRDIETYSLYSPLQRVARYFIDLQAKTDDVWITLPVTKGVMASRLSMSPEAFSRTLRDLADSGLVEVRGCHIAIRDARRLRKLLAI